MPSFVIDRRTLVAGVSTAITPPRDAGKVKIGNATADDLQVYTIPNDSTAMSIVPAGFQDEINLGELGKRFAKVDIAFWLIAVQSGDVVLKWL